MMAHNALGSSSLYRGDITHAREHLDQSIALYDPAAHGSLATRFSGVDFSVASFTYRSTALWLLGYPDAALVDAGKALKDAREIGHIVTLMHALLHSFTWVHCGKYEVASAQADELIALADEKSTPFWKAAGTASKGQVFAATGKALDAIDIMASGRTIWRSTGATLFAPLGLSFFARAYAELGQFESAWRSIGQAIKVVETAKERWSEAEVHRIAGEITLNSPKPDAAKAEAYFQRALDVARQQEAKSWELRAAMSMARLWRDQGKRDDEARDLLAPVYGWFTEGFDTHDLKEAKALLDELVA
jgi:predicted ATPase